MEETFLSYVALDDVSGNPQLVATSAATAHVTDDAFQTWDDGHTFGLSKESPSLYRAEHVDQDDGVDVSVMKQFDDLRRMVNALRGTPFDEQPLVYFRNTAWPHRAIVVLLPVDAVIEEPPTTYTDDDVRRFTMRAFLLAVTINAAHERNIMFNKPEFMRTGNKDIVVPHRGMVNGNPRDDDEPPVVIAIDDDDDVDEVMITSDKGDWYHFALWYIHLLRPDSSLRHLTEVVETDMQLTFYAFTPSMISWLCFKEMLLDRLDFDPTHAVYNALLADMNERFSQWTPPTFSQN